MKFSVIIPVYNAYAYLPKCVHSVLKQDYKNFEVLLVDDGSTDNSPLLCDEFAQKDGRVKVIHKKNGGTSDARNSGLRASTGDYVMFMDNDDFWDDEKALYEIAQQLEETNADVLIFPTKLFHEDTGTIEAPKALPNRSEICNTSNTETAEQLAVLIHNRLLIRAVWSKVIRRTLIIENDLFFEKGLRNEDTDWTARLLLCAKNYDVYLNPFYVYRKGHSSAQTSKGLKYKEVHDLTVVLERSITAFEKTTDASLRKVLLSYLAYPYAVWMAQIRLVDKSKIKEDIKLLKSYAYLLNYNLDPDVAVVSKVYRLLGFQLTSFLLKLYMQNKYNL